jgi:hypothetical protein
MTDKNLGDEALNSQLLRDLGASAGKAAKQEGMLSDAEKALAQRVAEQTAAQQQLADSIYLASIKLVSFGSGLSNNAGNDFSSINKMIGATTKIMGGMMSMIPYVGGAIDGVIKGAGEVAQFMVTTFAKAYGNFEKLSDTGVIATFQDLKTNSDATGLTFADTAKVMGQYSKELALFGGNALTGAKRFQAIANDAKEMSKEFQKIGISAADFADFQLNYINQQTLARRGQKMSDKQIEEGSKAYIEQLDTLAKMTGQSRKDIQSDLKSRMENAYYASSIATLTPTIKTTIDSVLTNVKMLGPGLDEGLTELLSTTGVAHGDDAKALRHALSVGGLGADFYSDVKKGLYTAEQANMKILEALSKYKDISEGQAVFLGDSAMQTKLYVAANKASVLVQKQYVGQQSEVAKNRQAVIDATDDANSDLAKSRREMYGATRNIDLLATSSGLMTTVMKGMAEGIDKVTEELYNLLGDEVPEYIKLRREEFKKQTELNNMRRDLNKQLELETKLKTLDPNSKEYFEADDQLKTLKFNNYNWGKLLTDQIKTSENELKDIQTRRRAADEKEMPGSTGSTSSSAAPTGGTTGTSTSGTTGGTPTGGTSSGTSSGTPTGGPTGGTTGTSGTSGTPATPGSSDASQGITASSATTGASGPLPTSVGTGPEGWLQVYALAKAAGDKYPEVSASQWALESGWGKSMSGKNNPFGQKAGSQESGTVVPTREVVNGRSVMMNQKFKDYSSSLEAVAEHVKRWSPKYSTAKSPEEAISMIARQYATAPDYASKISQIIRQQKNAIPAASTASAVAAAPVGANLGTSGAVQASGSSTGFPAVFFGDTAVVPANSGSEASAVTQQTSASNNHIRIAKLVSSKIDKVIDISKMNLIDTRRTVNA